MKKILFSISGIIIIAFLFSCNSNNTSESTTKEKDYSDFEVFYADFQEFIANDDIEGLKSISSEHMIEFYDEGYANHVNDEMKKVIAETSADKVETYDDRKIIYYKHYYEGANLEFEAGYSSYGFGFEKIDGKWIISEPFAAG